jgi:hypothetical protein
VCEGAGGDVEGAAGFARQLLGDVEDPKQVVADADRTGAGLAAEPHQFAVFPIVAHHRVEHRDPLERARRRVACGIFGWREQHDPRFRRHLSRREFVAGERRTFRGSGRPAMRNRGGAQQKRRRHERSHQVSFV